MALTTCKGSSCGPVALYRILGPQQRIYNNVLWKSWSRINLPAYMYVFVCIHVYVHACACALWWPYCLGYISLWQVFFKNCFPVMIFKMNLWSKLYLLIVCNSLTLFWHQILAYNFKSWFLKWNVKGLCEEVPLLKFSFVSH